jgi:hypothetical protein
MYMINRFLIVNSKKAVKYYVKFNSCNVEVFSSFPYL